MNATVNSQITTDEVRWHEELGESPRQVLVLKAILSQSPLELKQFCARAYRVSGMEMNEWQRM